MNNKNFMKRGPRGPHSYFFTKWVWYFYWFHSNTPNSRHLFNTNDANVYLMHFHSQKLDFKVSKEIWIIHYPSQCGEINCVDISKDFTTMFCFLILKKKLNLLLYIIKFVKHFDRFFDTFFNIFFKNKWKFKIWDEML